MRKRTALLLLLLVATALGALWCVSVQPNADSPDGSGAATNPPEGERMLEVPPRRSGVCLARMVDSSTGWPIADCAVIVSREGSKASVKTDREGYVSLDHGNVVLRPADGGTFEEVSTMIAGDSARIPLSARFKVVIRSDGNYIAWLRDIADADQLAHPGGQQDTDGPGGLRFGPVLAEWREPGEFWHPVANGTLVLHMQQGTVIPAHTLWSGEVKDVGDGYTAARVPDLVGPPVVSAVMSARPGASYEFVVTEKAAGVSLDYVLDGSGADGGIVHLMGVGRFAGGVAVRQVAYVNVQRGEQVIAFGAVDPGPYIIRSALVRDKEVHLAWQSFDIAAGVVRATLLEAEGRGPRTLWLDNCSEGLVLISLSCGSRNGYPVTYSDLGSGGVRALVGLHDDRGSLRVLDPSQGHDKRHAFDIQLSPRLSLAAR